jgi:8-oxo-dGTP diphosphatase
VITFPVEQADGCALRRFEPASDADLVRLDPSIPLPAALVVVWHAGECLLVFNRYRQAWELPGGIIDPGESARDAAVRELWEESGQRADGIHLAGVAEVWYAPARRREHLAIYRGTAADRAPFVENDEMTQSLWWNPVDPLDGLQEIDEALVRLCPPAGTR